MNQEQVKAELLRLDSEVEDFSLRFSGKSSVRVNGLYKPDIKEIIIHNQNFENNNSLIYTSIHEFAHHIQFTRFPGKSSARAHTNAFWNIFHNLLKTAEDIGVHTAYYKTDPDLMAMTQRIKDDYLVGNGKLMLEFGAVLLEAQNLCLEKQVNFQDYMDRALGLHRNVAKNIIKITEMELPPEIGYENMKTVASIKDDYERTEAVEAFLGGFSPDMVKGLSGMPQERTQLDALIEEKERIEKSLDSLTTKLVKVERKIQELQ